MADYDYIVIAITGHRFLVGKQDRTETNQSSTRSTAHCSSTTPRSERAASQSSVAQPVNTWWSFATAVEGFCGGVTGHAEAQMGLATGRCCGERQEPT